MQELRTDLIAVVLCISGLSVAGCGTGNKDRATLQPRAVNPTAAAVTADELSPIPPGAEDLTCNYPADGKDHPGAEISHADYPPDAKGPATVDAAVQAYHAVRGIKRVGRGSYTKVYESADGSQITYARSNTATGSGWGVFLTFDKAPRGWLLGGAIDCGDGR